MDAALYTVNSGFEIGYRNNATTVRARLVAAPLRFQARNTFLCAFYVAI